MSKKARTSLKAKVPENHKRVGKTVVVPAPEKSGAIVASTTPSYSAIVRHRLLATLDAETRPRLIVIQAPAGYGKSSLLRQHCDSRAALGEKVAWVRMDAQSSDPGHFLRLLCEAVSGFAASKGRKKQRSLSGVATLQDLLRGLSAISEPLVLVVDNFETAAVPEFEALFAQVVRSLPPTVQLCVGTRVLPAARLAQLQIRDGTVMISNEELCFRPSETREFFKEFHSLSPAEVAQIHERTDGWPAALQAYRLGLRRGARFRVEAWAGKGITRELMDFLAAEMFDNLAPALGMLLLELAIPEKLSAELVEHITGESRGAERLAEIERAGLFLAQADLHGAWLRFHNLFRQFLLGRAQKKYNIEDLALRHRRIARWYADRDLREEAIGHWIDGGEPERAADLLAGIVDELVAQERLGLIETIANQLPPEALLKHDNLVRGAVVAYGFRRAFDKAETLLDLHRTALEAGAADEGAMGLHNFSRLFLLAAQDRIEQLGSVAIEAGQQLTDKNSSAYAITLNAGGMLSVGQGKFDEARELMLRAQPIHDQANSLFGRAYCDAIYSMSLFGQGRIEDALRYLEVALRRTERRTLSSVSAGSVTAAYLVSCLYERNRIEDCERVIRDYAPLVNQQTIVDAVASMGILRARILQDQGRVGEAEEILERLIYLGYRHGLNRLTDYAHAELARAATLRGDLSRAEQWLMQLPQHCRESGTVVLMFHAGETEACHVGWVRWLIRSDRCNEALKIVGPELRRASAAGLRRRELKLHLMSAMALSASGKPKLAGRSLLAALEIGAQGGFVRSFLDEKEPLIAMLLQLRKNQNEVAALADQDPVVAYLEQLLTASGERLDVISQ